MAVAECHEIVGREGSEDKITNKRYVRTFRILCDLPTDGAGEVLACPDLPQRGDVWEAVDAEGTVTDTDFDAFCVERRVSSSDPNWPGLWVVVCNYAGKGDPTLEPPRVVWSTVKFQKTFQKDVNNKRYATTLGEPFEGGRMRDATRFTLVIKRNVLTWDPIEALDFIDSVNQYAYLTTRHPPGFDPGTCKLSDLSADAVWLEDNSDIHYYEWTARIEFCKDGWDTKILNAGYEVKNPSSPTGRSPFVNEAGRSPVPVPLTESGDPLPSGAEPYYIPFVEYLPANWGSLDLEF